MSENEPERMVPIDKLRQEEGASELAPDMEPYLAYIMATMQGGDGKAALEIISKLPLEKRYVWRVASALRWAFADAKRRHTGFGADNWSLRAAAVRESDHNRGSGDGRALRESGQVGPTVREHRRARVNYQGRDSSSELCWLRSVDSNRDSQD